MASKSSDINKLLKSLEVIATLMEVLEKSKKSDLQSLGSDPKAQEVTDFAHSKLRDTLPNGQLGHENWSNFYVSQYKKDPSIHNPQTQEKLTHFMGMKHMPEVANFKFDSVKHPTMEAGLNALSEAEKKGNEKNKSEETRWTPQKGKKVIDLGGGMGWWDLGVSYDPDEGRACNHCGNVEGKSGEGVKDRLFSLRQEDPSKPGMAKPHVTVVNHKGYLGEMKGHSNNKPSSKFHEAIKSLLLSKNVKGVVGSGYAPENNFQGTDLSPEQYQEVVTQKPRIFSPDKSELPKKFSERDDLNPEVTDLNWSANAFQDKEADNILQAQHNKKYSTPDKILRGMETIDKNFQRRVLKNPAMDVDNMAHLLLMSHGPHGAGANQDDRESFINHRLMQDPKTADEIYNKLPLMTMKKLVGYAPNVSQELFDKVFDSGNQQEISRSYPNHPLLGPKHFNRLIELGEMGHWLNHKAMTPEIFNRALAKDKGAAIFTPSSPFFDKEKIKQTIPNAQYWGEQGVREFLHELKDNPNADDEVIAQAHKHYPEESSHALSSHPGYNQSMVNDLISQNKVPDAIRVTSKRPDLKIPKEVFDKYIDSKTNPSEYDQSFLFENKDALYNHPHFDPEHIDKMASIDPKLADHPKATDEQRYKIRQKPVDDFINDFHQLDGHSKEVLFGRLADKMTGEQRSALLNHPDTPTGFKAKFGGNALSDWNKAHVLYDGRMPVGADINPSVIDKALSHTDDVNRHQKLADLLVKHRLHGYKVEMTPEQAESFITEGHVAPHKMTDWLTDEQRAKFSKKLDNKEDLYKLWVKGRSDWKNLPPAAFKRYYKDIDENSDYDDQDLARTALQDESEARKHQLIHNTLGQNGKLEDLHRYKNSHDTAVAKAARAELQRRGQLQKSNSLFLLMKKVSKK